MTSVAREKSQVQVAGLFVYPVKSCRGIALGEAEIGPFGFRHDREFLIVDEADRFVTQRAAGALALIQVSLDGQAMRLTAPDAGELSVSLAEPAHPSHAKPARAVQIFNDQVLADDMGDEAAEWISGALRQTCRLVRVGSAYSRKVPLQRIPEIHRTGQEPVISFTDAFPTLLVSEESLADLNARLSESIPMDRFRPNIVVRGCAPYAENSWDVVRAGEVVFGCATTCLRCVVTSIDQQTGSRTGAEPLKTLATYQRSPDGNGVAFGQYLVHSGSGMLRVGDALSTEKTAR